MRRILLLDYPAYLASFPVRTAVSFPGTELIAKLADRLAFSWFRGRVKWWFSDEGQRADADQLCLSAISGAY